MLLWNWSDVFYFTTLFLVRNTFLYDQRFCFWKCRIGKTFISLELVKLLWNLELVFLTFVKFRKLVKLLWSLELVKLLWSLELVKLLWSLELVKLLWSLELVKLLWSLELVKLLWSLELVKLWWSLDLVKLSRLINLGECNRFLLCQIQRNQWLYFEISEYSNHHW